MTCNQQSRRPAATRVENAAILVSLELSRSKWLVTALLPGSEKMSKHSVASGDGPALLELLGRLRAKAETSTGGPVAIVTIQEAGLDGFWIHRLLEAHGIESHVVDAGSIAAPRRRRRAKSDGIDGEALIRTLAAWLRGEPRVCSMAVPPSIEDEDRRRLVREREALLTERVRQTNRIGGLLMAQGIYDYQPLRRDRRARLESLTTGDGHALPLQLKAEIGRALDHLELLCEQIAAVEKERARLLQAEAEAMGPVALLLDLRSIGPGFAAVLYLEGLFRSFGNRRQLASYAGLAPTPWQSGRINHDQGISKSGNPHLRRTMIELAWMWLRHQTGSALSEWFRRRVGDQGGRIRRIAIVALARKLLIALWRYVTQGVVPEGAVMKTALA